MQHSQSTTGETGSLVNAARSRVKQERHDSAFARSILLRRWKRRFLKAGNDRQYRLFYHWIKKYAGTFRPVLFLGVLSIVISCTNNKPQSPAPIKSFSGTIPDTLTIAEYNVENLFDMNDDGDEYPEFKPGRNNWTNAMFQTKLNNIASVLCAINAHVVVLIETENLNTVQELCRVMNSKGADYKYIAMGDNPGSGNTRPMIISKLPILSEKSFGFIPGPTHDRPMLEATIYLGKDTLTVIACHWPSKKAQESKRLEKAELLKAECGKIPKTKDYVIAGDFNENYDESESFHTTGLDDTRGVAGINHVMKTVVTPPGPNIMYTTKALCATTDSFVHFDPWLEIAESMRMSEAFSGRRETPDHFLLPHSMFDTLGYSYIDTSFKAFTWNGRLIKDGVPYRWEMRYTKHGKVHTGYGYSDHLPLVLKLARGEYQHSQKQDTLTAISTIKSTQGGFEDGFDGFIPCSKQIRIERDTLLPKVGKYCLKLYGQATKNGSAARTLLPLSTTKKKMLSFFIKGNGTINVRLGSAAQKKWVYFNGESFTPAKGGKYGAYSFASWKRVDLPLPEQLKEFSELDFEVRVKKETKILMWVDEVGIR